MFLWLGTGCVAGRRARTRKITLCVVSLLVSLVITLHYITLPLPLSQLLCDIHMHIICSSVWLCHLLSPDLQRSNRFPGALLPAPAPPPPYQLHSAPPREPSFWSASEHGRPVSGHVGRPRSHQGFFAGAASVSAVGAAWLALAPPRSHHWAAGSSRGAEEGVTAAAAAPCGVEAAGAEAAPPPGRAARPPPLLAPAHIESRAGAGAGVC